MPNITNLVLTLQHGGVGSTTTSPRTARVSFVANFSAIEVTARAVFRAEARIVSNENDRNRLIGTAIIQAASPGVPSVLTRTLTRGDLDEDADFFMPHGGGIEERENQDEWIARVTLSPVVFETVVASSPLVVGSWGNEGDD